MKSLTKSLDLTRENYPYELSMRDDMFKFGVFIAFVFFENRSSERKTNENNKKATKGSLFTFASVLTIHFLLNDKLSAGV